ncbi:MAG: ParB N-terminal domain-containing protein [Treponema sp.]|uniref:ParB N-terminal domain-containing protein n=1 Tax=Treponema sp. TaxID=166 RepID=UPI00298D8A86|nr:ParB N-terminal domain-containing protein [Treponema sp.]MCR5387267.1 ParB N-terminal domain-containing protein [Treponema sp.]
MLVNISEIKVKNRIRKDLGDLEPLKDSLRRYGLLNPITLDAKNRLIAGERRLQAAKEIGWTNINAVIINNLTPVTKLELELEENNQRKEFTDAELLEGYKRLEKLRNPGFFRKIFNAFIEFFKWIIRAIKRLFK